MRALIIAIVASALLHGVLFVLASRLKIEPPPPASKRVKITVVEPPPKKPEPPPPPKVVEDKPKPPPPKKKVVRKRKKVVRAPVRKDKTVPKSEPKPAETPPPAKPKPPPMGFSVSMESTVVGGGVAVTAVEGGGNMFADPRDTSIRPGKKTSQRPPPASGKGKGPGRGDIVITPPRFLTPGSKRSPKYPEQARQAGIEGQVVLRVYVGASGRVERVRVIKKLGYGCEDAAVAHAKSAWRFTPATEGGRVVGMWIPVPVTFVLDR